MSERKTVEEYLQLHQELKVIYVVDGYLATLYQDDDCTIEISNGKGSTVAEAIEDLTRNLPTARSR